MKNIQSILQWMLRAGAVCLAVSQTSFACVDAAQLKVLAAQETQAMLQRIPPAFTDAVNDGLIHGEMTLQSETDCLLRWQLTLPVTDIQEAQALLEAQPAKKIMLASQGYEIPQQSLQTAVFQLVAGQLKPLAKEELQTAQLGKLRASVELMYAMLTQARAQPLPVPPAAWPLAERQVLNQRCTQQFSAVDQANACDCRTQGIAARFSARQVSYNAYLSSNPYAFASGNGEAFTQLDKQLQQQCGLVPLAK